MISSQLVNRSVISNFYPIELPQTHSEDGSSSPLLHVYKVTVHPKMEKSQFLAKRDLLVFGRDRGHHKQGQED